MPGTLVFCATPIGNLADLSERAAETLASADVIFAEDTRRTAKLLRHIGATTPMKSFFAHNEQSRLREIEDHLRADELVAVVSDAGMPVVSDPGRSAVDAAIAVGATVTAIPGPSAVVTAIAVSGFSGDRFVFEGFLPRKGRDRAEIIAAVGDEQRTIVFFSTATRVARDLAAIAEASVAERRVVVARELTKIHEEVWRGSLAEGIEEWTDSERARGEFTVVVEGADPVAPDIDLAVASVNRLITSGSTTSDAVRQAAAETGVSRRVLYEKVVNDRG